MKYDQPLMIVLAALAFASCSSVNGRTEHDPRTNFAKYRTYSWAPHPKSGIQPGPGVRAQIEASLDQGLAATRARILWIPDPAKIPTGHSAWRATAGQDGSCTTSQSISRARLVAASWG